MSRNDGPEPRRALDTFADRYRALIASKGSNFARLAAATGFSRPYCSAAAKGREVPSEALVVELDNALDAGGELLRLRDEADRERTERRRRIAPKVPGPPGQDEGVSGTDRREFFEFGAAGLLAAETYRLRNSRPDPDVLTLGELDDEVTAHAAALTTTPHDMLAPRVFRTWRSAESLLEAGGRPKTLARLTRAAGYTSYTLCRLAFNLGDPTASRRFVTLAGEHAAQTDDPVLVGSVAEMTSTLAFYGHRYGEAVDEARRGAAASGGHPYVRARLAAYEARALAALGDASGAREALARMRSAAVVMPVQPGGSPFGPAAADMFHGGVLARIGAGVEAEPLARTAVAAHDRGSGSGFEEHGHALLALAAALVARENPEVDEAAALTARVVGMLDERPTSSVTTKVYDVVNDLGPYRELPPVRDVRDRLASRPRLALAAGAA